MDFVMNRNITITSRIGYTLVFEKDVAQHVPPAMVEAVMQRGGLPVEGELPPAEGDAEVVPLLRGNERENKLMDAVKEMVVRNNRNDFTGSGLPNAKVIEKIVGFAVTSEERNTVWKKYQGALDVSKNGQVDVA